MREITITANDAGRRLDRFLRKYLSNASLGEIYKLIRKDIKVDGKRRAQSYILNEGETITFYLSDEAMAALTGKNGSTYEGRGTNAASGRARRQFRIIYEDENILIVSKPFGLLTHGDQHEKKNHLANQVKDYLIEKGEYDPSSEKVFSPAPANRLDRNTTGLVLFGKTSAALKGLNKMIRDELTDKYYLTVAHGIIEEPLVLRGDLTKDEEKNRVKISRIRSGELSSINDRNGKHVGNLFHSNDIEETYGDRNAVIGDGRAVITEIEPLEVLDFDGGLKASLVRVKLVTGRPHQIRAHLAGIGHPVIGDRKYAHVISKDVKTINRLNRYLEQKYKLSTQLLHAYKICFAEEGLPEDLAYLSGKSFTAPLPLTFRKVLEDAGSKASY